MDIEHKLGSELKHKDIFIHNGEIFMVIEPVVPYATSLERCIAVGIDPRGTCLVLGNLTEPLKSFSEEIKKGL